MNYYEEPSPRLSFHRKRQNELDESRSKFGFMGQRFKQIQGGFGNIYHLY